MKDEFKVSFDPCRYTSKPGRFDIVNINDRIGHYIRTVNSDDIKAFVRMVGKEGCTFCPATFKDGKEDFTEGKRRKENFEQLQLMALDFDGGISFEEVKSRTERYELPILFAYDTFSSENHNKFRVVFKNDVSVTDARAARAMLLALTKIFPESDQSCSKDISRIYFGGKELLYYDDSIPEINPESLFRNLSFYFLDKYKVNHYKRKIAEFSKEARIALNDKNLLDISVAEKLPEVDGRSNGKNSPNPTIVLNTSGEKFPTRYYLINLSPSSTSTLCDKKKTKIHGHFRAGMLVDISSSCRLFCDFESGNRKLHHNELFGLATNLIQVESGSSRFKEIIKSNSYFEDYKKLLAWDYYLYYFKSNNYKPESCAAFCPYNDECQHGTNILSTSKLNYHQIEKLANYDEDFVSMEEAEDDFRRKLTKAIGSPDNK